MRKIIKTSFTRLKRCPNLFNNFRAPDIMAIIHASQVSGSVRSSRYLDKEFCLSEFAHETCMARLGQTLTNGHNSICHPQITYCGGKLSPAVGARSPFYFSIKGRSTTTFSPTSHRLRQLYRGISLYMVPINSLHRVLRNVWRLPRKS